MSSNAEDIIANRLAKYAKVEESDHDDDLSASCRVILRMSAAAASQAISHMYWVSEEGDCLYLERARIRYSPRPRWTREPLTADEDTTESLDRPFPPSYHWVLHFMCATLRYYTVVTFGPLQRPGCNKDSREVTVNEARHVHKVSAHAANGE